MAQTNPAAERSPLLQAIIDFSARHGRAPTAYEVRLMADFQQGGGLARLCEALADAGDIFALAMRGGR